jgi:mono/diheme cytochrome c family protein
VKLTPLVAFVVFALGCAKKPPPAPADAAPTVPVDPRAQAEKTLDSSCGVCHSLDVVHSQRLARSQWEKELKKMRGWGAIIADDEGKALVDWLAEVDGTDASAYAFASVVAADTESSVTPASLPAGADAARGEPTYKSVCAPCHGADAKGAALGPNLARRPISFHPTEFAKIVEEGRARMPGYKGALDASQMADILAYVQSR